ncbi:hypothetical protein QAD02_017249 [Eretmocerus hayati]|uniref:Uncharacterized protein n=2 Tax=Eretmocerus hayati TaxID=131215 RepID=A0ACC2PCV6_9HYME|nr:hypothetical protein QAD02_017246 [Eretmocerus hayati]KAJ8681462.1 hypothetical protein QAD02_017249 [Eretmocerus hayati]
MRKPLECGSYWNADRTHGAAQPFDVGIRMQLYGVAWPLEIGMRMQLYRAAQPLEIGMRMQLYRVTQLLEIGMRIQLYRVARLFDIGMRKQLQPERDHPAFGMRMRLMTRPIRLMFRPQLWNVKYPVRCAATQECEVFPDQEWGASDSPATRSYIRRATEWLSLTCVLKFLSASLCIELLLTYAYFNLHIGLPRYARSSS